MKRPRKRFKSEQADKPIIFTGGVRELFLAIQPTLAARREAQRFIKEINQHNKYD